MSEPVSYVVTVDGRVFDITIATGEDGLIAWVGDHQMPVGWQAGNTHAATLRLGDRRVEALIARDGETWWVALAGYQAEVQVAEARALRLAATLPQVATRTGRLEVRAPMPGRVVAVPVAAGAAVERGAVVAILEAMKMENQLRAPQAGCVVEVRVSEGATVDHGAVLLVIHSDEEAPPPSGRTEEARHARLGQRGSE